MDLTDLDVLAGGLLVVGNAGDDVVLVELTDHVAKSVEQSLLADNPARHQTQQRNQG